MGFAADPEAAGAADAFGAAEDAFGATEALAFADAAGFAEDAAGAADAVGATAAVCAEGACDGDAAGAAVGSGFSGGAHTGPPFGATAVGVAMGGFGSELHATTTVASTAALTKNGRAEIRRASRTLRMLSLERRANLPPFALRHSHRASHLGISTTVLFAYPGSF